MNNEDILQHQCIKAFSEKYPEQRGLLFAVINDTYSRNHAVTMRSLGMISGAADLIYVRDGKIVGIEVKHEGSIHDADHIRRQLWWGETIIKSGGEYYMVSSVEAFFGVIEKRNVDQIYTINKIEKLLSKGTKTVKISWIQN